LRWTFPTPVRTLKDVKWDDVTPSDASASQTSTGLLRRAQADESDAWQLLVQTYSRRIYRWCRQAGLQPADAANVVQEVLRAVARKLGDFHRDRVGDTFRGWLRRITQNKLRDHHRNLSRQLDQPVGGTDAHRRVERLPFAEVTQQSQATASGASSCLALSQWGQHLVDRIRAEISDRDWRLFWRVVVDGQSAAEAGEEFGLTANAVRLVKMRVLRRLRAAAAEPPGRE
jgi:RNA polymerase sigma-70 factor (ECF subfamily)